MGWWGRALKKSVLPLLEVGGPPAEAKEREGEGILLWLHHFSQPSRISGSLCVS